MPIGISEASFNDKRLEKNFLSRLKLIFLTSLSWKDLQKPKQIQSAELI